MRRHLPLLAVLTAYVAGVLAAKSDTVASVTGAISLVLMFAAGFIVPRYYRPSGD